MDAATIAVEATIEETHWWFAGRRQLFARELALAGAVPDSKILDVGTGTGTNLRMLRELNFSHVTGLDHDETAIGFCQSKGLGPVRQGDICAMPFEDHSFDLILATDVVEHVDHDLSAFREIARTLKDDGKALIAVPAFPSLWGLQDEVAHHKRRYRLKPLLQQMRKGGLRPLRFYHFNYLLFIPIWIARRIIDLLRIKRNSEAEFNSPVINRVLSWVFSIDVATARVLRPPFGVSILVICEKLEKDSDSGRSAPENSVELSESVPLGYTDFRRSKA